jgi:hypothetical protein
MVRKIGSTSFKARATVRLMCETFVRMIKGSVAREALMKIVLAGLAALLLSGCAATSLGPAASVADEQVQFRDKRPEAETKTFRQGILSPIIYLADEDFEPKAIEHFRAALWAKRPPGMSGVRVEVTKFRIADYFPRRMSAAIGGGLAAQGIYSTFDLAPGDVDGVYCLFEGTLNGRPVKTSSFLPYLISPLAGLVRQQPEFIAAVKASIDKCAENALLQSQ